jgi:hypothetical protein
VIPSETLEDYLKNVFSKHMSDEKASKEAKDAVSDVEMDSEDFMKNFGE